MFQPFCMKQYFFHHPDLPHSFLKTVVGTDIADLLLKEHRSVWLPGKSPNQANLIDFNNEPLARAEEEPGAGPLSLLSDTFMIVPENIGKETERFRELLLFGRKKVKKVSLNALLSCSFYLPKSDMCYALSVE